MGSTDGEAGAEPGREDAGAENGDGDVHDRATWAELFYDLVQVFALIQATHILAGDPSPAGLGRTVLILAPLWWSWVGATLLVNGVAETHGQRLLLFCGGALTLSMAAAAPHALDDGRGAAAVYAGSYALLRLLLGVAMLRKHAFAQVVNPYTVAMVTALTLAATAALPPGPRVVVWSAVVALELSVPALLGRRLYGMTFGVSHLPERFGLFIIIALGETVVDAGGIAGERPLTPLSLFTLALAFATGTALWWLYFNFAASAVAHALRVHRTPAVVVRDVLGYGHFALVIGLLVTAVGVAGTLHHPLEAAHGTASALLPAGAALFTLTFCFTRWRMFGAAGVTRLAGGAALAALIPVAHLLPQLAVLCAVTALLTALNLWEHRMVSSGRPLLLLPRAH